LPEATELGEDFNGARFTVELLLLGRHLPIGVFIEIWIIARRDQVQFGEDAQFFVPHLNEQIFDGWLATADAANQLHPVMDRGDPSGEVVDRKVKPED
jgi:hypothetical protein